MWNTLSLPWQLCVEQAWEAYCAGSIPVGAVVTHTDGKILSVGRNRTSEASSECERQISAVPLAHAEVNALLALDYVKIDPHSCILYTLVEPCPLCIGAICMAGIKELHYAARDPWGGSTNLLDATPYLRWKNIKAIGPGRRDFETAIRAVEVDYQLRTGGSRVESVLDVWGREDPEAVRKGRSLFESGELPRMQEERLSAEDAFCRLSELLANW